MIVGVGSDIVEIERIKNACERWPRFGDKIFTRQEWEYCDSGKSYQSLAGRFAAKEAVLKAMGTGLRGLTWTEVEINNDLAGAPFVTLTGKAAKIAEEKGIKKIFISLAHSNDYAVAHAIASGGE